MEATGDPWDVFGSVSEEDYSVADIAPPQLPPPTTRPSVPGSRSKKKRPLWEAILPTFDGVTDSGGAVDFGGDVRGGVVGGKRVEASVVRAPFSAPPVYQNSSVRYEACMPHRGGGRGFVASADIAPGTLLLVEERFLPMPTAFECGLAGGIGQEELCLKWILGLPLPRLKEVLVELRLLHPQSLEDLPVDEMQGLLSRHQETAKGMVAELGEDSSRETGLDVRGIVRLFGALQSNGFASGIYLHPAMTNHSCRPNAIKWRAGKSIADTGGSKTAAKKDTDVGGSEGAALSEIRATELILEGEEITISYLEPREIARASRQSRLAEQFGFDCDCRLCNCSDGFAAPLDGFTEGNKVGDEERNVTDEEGKNDEHGDGVEGAMEEDDGTRGLVVQNVLEKRLEAAESVMELSRAKEVKWSGVLSEVLGYRRQAAGSLNCRHIALARADKLIAKACVAILQGSESAAEADAECVESVTKASTELPASFGGVWGGNELHPLDGCFKTRLLVVLLAALLSRRKTQLLYLGNGPHPEVGACLADMSQAMGMLLAQGSNSEKWIRRLPGNDERKIPRGGRHGASTGGVNGEGREGGVGWWDDGALGASRFERASDKAAKKIDGLFQHPQAP